MSSSSGSPSPSSVGTVNSRLLAIAPTSQPSASAASWAVCTESGSTTIRPVPPRALELGAEPGDGCVLAAVRGLLAHGRNVANGCGFALDGLSEGRCTLKVFEHVFDQRPRWRVTSTPILHRGTDRGRTAADHR